MAGGAAGAADDVSNGDGPVSGLVGQLGECASILSVELAQLKTKLRDIREEQPVLRLRTSQGVKESDRHASAFVERCRRGPA
eukprot:6585644-Prymnesium_polylepis.1